MAYRKLNRDCGQRRALLRNAVTSFLAHGRITTTEAKAKEIRSLSEKMITLAKKGNLNARRQAFSYIMDEAVVKELFETIGPKYEDRQGGYTRILKVGPRRGDAAPMVVLELI